MFANVGLKTVEEDYYDFLVLSGKTERNFLTYRTLDSNKYSTEDCLWSLKDGQFGDFTVYGPEVFSSYNSYEPWGQNDGALWQGKGLNGQFKAGVSYSKFGFTFTFKPEICYSQNLEFETIKGAYGNFWSRLDRVQRFGDEPFFTFDWGDSEVRYYYKNLTVGFGRNKSFRIV